MNICSCYTKLVKFRKGGRVMLNISAKILDNFTTKLCVNDLGTRFF